MSEFKKNAVWLLIFAAIATVQVLTGLIVLSYWMDDQVLGGYVTYGTYATFFIPFVLKLGWNQGTRVGFFLLFVTFLFGSTAGMAIFFTSMKFLHQNELVSMIFGAAFVIAATVAMGARLLESQDTPAVHPFNRDTLKAVAVIVGTIVVSITLPALLGTYGAIAMACVWIGISIWSIVSLRNKNWYSAMIQMLRMGGLIFIFVNGIVFEAIAFSRESEMPIPREALIQFEFLYVLMVIHIAFVCGEIYSNAKLEEQRKGLSFPT